MSPSFKRRILALVPRMNHAPRIIKPLNASNRHTHFPHACSSPLSSSSSVQRLAIRNDKQLEGGSKISLDYLWKRSYIAWPSMNVIPLSPTQKAALGALEQGVDSA